MDIFFTYLQEKKQEKIVDFLDKEIESLDYLISLNSTSKVSANKVLNNYSKSLFIISNEEESDAIILN